MKPKQWICICEPFAWNQITWVRILHIIYESCYRYSFLTQKIIFLPIIMSRMVFVTCIVIQPLVYFVWRMMENYISNTNSYEQWTTTLNNKLNVIDIDNNTGTDPMSRMLTKNNSFQYFNLFQSVPESKHELNDIMICIFRYRFANS